MDIAVVLDENERTASFEKNTFIQVYSKTENGWISGAKVMVDVENEQDAYTFNESLAKLMDQIPKCKLLVVKSISNPYLTFFEEQLFHIWEMEGNPLDYLDYVYDSHSQEQRKKNLQKKLIAPIRTEEGDYYINLQDIMNDNSPLTSKQVLIPFFQEKNFKKLIVDCDHYPRWFDSELPKTNFNVEICEREDGIQVIVRNEE